MEGGWEREGKVGGDWGGVGKGCIVYSSQIIVLNISCMFGAFIVGQRR